MEKLIVGGCIAAERLCHFMSQAISFSGCTTAGKFRNRIDFQKSGGCFNCLAKDVAISGDADSDERLHYECVACPRVGCVVC